MRLKGQAGQFDWFFKDPDKHSVLIRATPATEYLHHCVLNLLQDAQHATAMGRDVDDRTFGASIIVRHGFSGHSSINGETEKELHARHRESEIIHE